MTKPSITKPSITRPSITDAFNIYNGKPSITQTVYIWKPSITRNQNVYNSTIFLTSITDGFTVYNRWCENTYNEICTETPEKGTKTSITGLKTSITGPPVIDAFVKTQNSRKTVYNGSRNRL